MTTDLAGLHVLMTADAVGGVWTYATELAGGLRARGARVTVAALGPAPDGAQRAAAGADLAVLGGTLDWLAETPDAVATSGAAVARLARSVGADLVHLNSPALAAEADFDRPVVAACHSCVRTWWEAVRATPLPTDFAWRADLLARGYARADALLTPSRAFADATAAAYSLTHAPTVVWNGRSLPDPGSLHPRHAEERPEAASRSTHDRPACFETPPGLRPGAPQHDEGGEGRGQAPFVFTAGRLWDDGKDVATLDAAAASLPAPVLAAGPLAGPNGTTVVLRHARALGRLEPASVDAHLRRRPVFASPALYEPFGLAVLEAAGHGCPLVLSDIATFRELWDGAAFFVRSRDPAALAAALRRVLSDTGLAASLGAAARARAARYTLDAMADGTAALYRAVLGRHGAALRLAS